MRWRILYPVIVALLFPATGSAQLSPGDLTTAHADLEGMSNCTKCHDLGNKVTNAKCLDCHKEIKALLDRNKGYHASKAVRSKDCAQCHSEHNGRKFDMVRFDVKTFDHGTTGYPLEGAHRPIDCRQCHAPDNITDRQIAARAGTYLGLEKACLSCHDDEHQGTLPKDCAQCHGMDAFKPATAFDHAKTDYPLKGGHVTVDCRKCHAIEQRNNKPFQRFTDVPHADCKACHADVHDAHFAGACAQCHVEEGFDVFAGKGRFDHNLTPFKLNGRHRTVDCFECHKRTSDPLTVFQDRAGVRMDQCATCHADKHEGKFGADCASCHQEKGWVELKTMDRFDHNKTDYPLQGLHVNVDCRKCHKERYTDPLVFNTCNSCHSDYHQGEFARNGTTPDCAECHFLTDPFEVSLYSLEQHGRTEFPLTGAHLATPCFACHLVEGMDLAYKGSDRKKWMFRDLSTACYDCHENVHGEEFVEAGVTDCKRCHITDDWYPSLFDHARTAFPLEGEHKNVACKECHVPGNNGRVASFKSGKLQCADCHQ